MTTTSIQDDLGSLVVAYLLDGFRRGDVAAVQTILQSNAWFLHPENFGNCFAETLTTTSHVNTTANDYMERLRRQDETARQMFTLLLQHGADPNAANTDNGEMPLHVACRRGWLLCVQLLLTTSDANVEALQLFTQEIPLAVACRYWHSNILSYLIQAHHADPNFACSGGYTPLLLAVSGLDEPMVQVLLDNGADPNVLTRHDGSPWHEAAAGGYLDILSRMLWHYGGNVNLQSSSNGATPLRCAVTKRRTAVVQTLLSEFHADPNLATNSGETPLHRACWNDDMSMVRLLLQHGAVLSAVDDRGRTAPHCAYNVPSIVRLLLEQARDDGLHIVNAQDCAGETALFYCIRHDTRECAELLLDSGRVRLDVRNHDKGSTALHVAAATVDAEQEFVSLLLRYAAGVADVNAVIRTMSQGRAQYPGV